MIRGRSGGSSWTRKLNRVFVAALGHAYGPNQERGVFRSKDGGKSWQKILFHDENTGAIDLAFEPENPKTIYATMWQTRRPPWSIYPPSNGPGSGLYRSSDGGDHWDQVTGRDCHQKASPNRHRFCAEQSAADLFDRGRQGGRALSF